MKYASRALGHVRRACSNGWEGPPATRKGLKIAQPKQLCIMAIFISDGWRRSSRTHILEEMSRTLACITLAPSVVKGVMSKSSIGSMIKFRANMMVMFSHIVCAGSTNDGSILPSIRKHTCPTNISSPQIGNKPAKSTILALVGCIA